MRRLPKSFDAKAFILTRLPLTAVPGLSDIIIHLAGPHSGLGRLPHQTAVPPYWAYLWAGGMALAHHLRAQPQTVAGKRILDLGAGSGLVGIVAAQAGAAAVFAAEIDSMGQVATAMNAAANGVEVSVIGDDLLADSASRPRVDVILVGDLFYDQGLTDRVTAFLDICLASGTSVLIGDPGRTTLPRARMRLIAEYHVRDVGDATGAASTVGQVLTFI